MGTSVSCRSTTAQRRDVRNVELTDIKGYLEFVTRHREQDQHSKVGSGDLRFEETLLEESIKLETEGFVYHPNLLEFSLGALLGLEQGDFDELSDDRLRKSSEEGPVYEFDFRGQFLKKKNYPGSVFARRDRRVQPRAFQPSLETTTTSYGFTWQYVDEKTPINLHFNDTDIRLEPRGGNEPDGRQKNTTLRLDAAFNVSDHLSYAFLYERQEIEEQPFELDFKQDELTFTRQYRFGNLRQHRLESEINYFNQRGTFDVERGRWRELVRLQHTEDLRSWYRWEMSDRKQGSLSGVPPIEERSYNLTGTIEHRLYDSLITELLVFGHFQEFASGLDIDRAGAQISFDYRKKNRWGNLQATWNMRFTTEDREGADRPIEVLDERQIFSDPEPVVLTNTNINLGSIFMTAEDRITVYRIGRDFTALPVGDRLELRRIATGRLPDGATVLIDYNFLAAGSFVLDTYGHDVNLRQNFEWGLSPYYRLRYQKQVLQPRTATGAAAEDISAHIFGAEYRKGSILLSAEYEGHASTINPHEAVRLTADYTRRFKHGATGLLKGRWTDMHYTMPRRDTSFFTVEGRYRYPIRSGLIVEAGVIYRRERDSLSGNDEGFDSDLALEWYIRETEIRLTFEYGEFDDDFSDNKFSTLFLQVRRRF